jgi:site-specific DNA-methyltransferase (adenine-specific)
MQSHFINASCFELLGSVATNSVDLVLIDPPYLISRDTGFSSGNNPDYDRLKVSMDFGKWDHRCDGLDQAIHESFRVLRNGGTFICFYDLWKLTELAQTMEAARFKQLRFLEWVKTNPVPLNQSVNYLTNAREIALLGVKGGKPTFNGKYDNGIYNYPIEHSKERFHPTQKNEDLIADLISKHSKPGDTVLDCFAGSATTGAAALKLGRNFIGCELDPGYFAKASERLERCNTQAVLEVV